MFIKIILVNIFIFLEDIYSLYIELSHAEIYLITQMSLSKYYYYYY